MKSTFYIVLAVATLAACDRKMQIETSEAPVAALETDAPVAGLQIILERAITNEEAPVVSWTVDSTGAVAQSFELIAANDAECQEEVARQSVAAALQTTLTGIADGTYHLCLFALAKDAIRHAAANNGVEIVIDRVPPVIVTGGQTVLTNKPVTMTFTTTDATAVAYAWSKANGPADVAFSDSTTEKPTISATSDGAYTVQLLVTDAAGNEQTASFAFNWDQTPPAITAFTAVHANAAYTVAPVVDATAATYRWEKVSGPGPLAISDAAVKNPTLTGTTDSTYVVKFSAADALGNEASAELTLYWDSILPTVTIANDFINAANKASVNVNGTCSEDGRMITIGGTAATTAPCISGTWSVLVDLSAPADGNVPLTADLSDAAGNNAVQATVNLVKDTVLPTVTFDNLVINALNQGAAPISGTCSENSRTVTIGGAVNATATCNAGTWTTNVDYSGQPDGNVAVTANLSDAAGNPAAQATRNLTKDSSGPAVTITNIVINNANKAAVPLAGTCSENGQPVVIGGAVADTVNCAAGAWTKNIDYSAQPDGTVNVTADHEDTGGNDATQAVRSLTKDTVAPTVSIANVVVNNANKAAVPLTGSCSENGRTVTIGGPVNTTATCAAGSWSKSVDYSGQADGTVNVTADLDDAAGNNATQATRGLTKDTSVPTVTISNVVINNANKAAVPLTGTCSENGRTVTIGGPVNTTATCTAGNWSKSIDYSGEADGTVNVTADLDDAAGNNATQATRGLTKDTGIPTVTLDNIVINNANKAALARPRDVVLNPA